MTKLKSMIAAAGGVLVLTAAVLAPGGVSAHHSVAAFDLTRRSAMSGVVTKFEYRNPHGWVFIQAVVKGQPATYALELGPPAALRRAGLRFDAIKVGDKVSVEFAPSRDGHPQGLLTKIVWTDGRSWEPTGSASPIMPGAPKPVIGKIN